MAHRSQRGNSITLTVLILQLTIEGADKKLGATIQKNERLQKSSNKKRIKNKS